MSNFFTSPKESASTSLYDLAISGKTPWDAQLSQLGNNARTNLRRNASYESAGMSGDILSQAESAGVTFTSGVTDNIIDAKSKLREKEYSAESELQTQLMHQRIASLAQLLQTGMAGLSSSSTFGDVLSGLTTITSIGSGVLTGLGPEGLGVIGLPKKTDSPGVKPGSMFDFMQGEDVPRSFH